MRLGGCLKKMVKHLTVSFYCDFLFFSVCPYNCTEENNPVCSTNAVTYENECKLVFANCLNNTGELAYEGPCRGKVALFLHST